MLLPQLRCRTPILPASMRLSHHPWDAEYQKSMGKRTTEPVAHHPTTPAAASAKARQILGCPLSRPTATNTSPTHTSRWGDPGVSSMSRLHQTASFFNHRCHDCIKPPWQTSPAPGNHAAASSAMQSPVPMPRCRALSPRPCPKAACQVEGRVFGVGWTPEAGEIGRGEDGAMDARGMRSSWKLRGLLQEIDPGPPKEGN